jgi:hypothetical protein
MNKLHIMFLTCLLSAPLAFSMDVDTPKRTNPSRTRRPKREREQSKLNPDDLNPRSWKNLSHFETRTAIARLEASTKPHYGKWHADTWLKSLQARHQEVDHTVEAKIHNLAQRKEILIQSYPNNEEEYEDLIQEELCQLALENWIAVNPKKNSTKKSKNKKERWE